MASKIFSCLSFTCSERSLWRTTVIVLQGNKHRSLTSLCQRGDDKSLLASKILKSKLLFVLKYFESDIAFTSLEFAGNFRIERINCGIVLYGDIFEDSIDINQIKLHVELPSKVSHFIDALAQKFGRIVTMIDQNRDERDDSAPNAHRQRLLEHGG